MNSRKEKAVTRICAVLLVGGGLIGITIAAFMIYNFVQQHWLLALIGAGMGALFSWSLLVGVQLWRGTEYGQKWAFRMFVSQIPLLSFPGFVYQWYTGGALLLAAGDVESTISMKLGSAANFYLGIGGTDGTMFGVNLLAIAAAVSLWAVRSNNSFKRTAAPEFE